MTEEKEKWIQQRKETQDRFRKELIVAEILNRARADKTTYKVI